MKRTSAVMYIFLMVAAFGCSKESDSSPELVATKFPVPAWKVDDTGKYPATMTAVVTVPANLAENVTETDQLAAFVNNECRGLGTLVTVDKSKLFFVLIQGLPEEASKITFRYFSSKTTYMFESLSALNFKIDAVYGTAENPKTLELTQLK